MEETTQSESEHETEVGSRLPRRKYEDIQMMNKSRMSAYSSAGDIIRPKRSSFIKRRGISTLLCCSRNSESEDEFSAESDQEYAKTSQSWYEKKKEAGYVNIPKEDETASYSSEVSRRTSQESFKQKEENSLSDEESTSNSATSDETDDLRGKSDDNLEETDNQRNVDQNNSEEMAPGKETSNLKNIMMQSVDAEPLNAAGILNAICKSAISILPTNSSTNSQQEKVNPSSALETIRGNYNSPFYRNWTQYEKRSKYLNEAENKSATLNLKRRSSDESDEDSKRESKSDSEVDTDERTRSSENTESRVRRGVVSRDLRKCGKTHNRRRYTSPSSSASSEERVRRKAARRDSSQSSQESSDEDSDEDNLKRRGSVEDWRHRGRRVSSSSESDGDELRRGRHRHRSTCGRGRSRIGRRGTHSRSRCSRSVKSHKHVRHRRRGSKGRSVTKHHRRKKSRKLSRRTRLKSTPRRRYRSGSESDSDSRSRPGRKVRRKIRRRRCSHPKAKYAKKHKKGWSDGKEVLFGSPSNIKTYLQVGGVHGRDTYISGDGISREASESVRERKSRQNQHLYDMRRRRRRSQVLSPVRYRLDGRRDTRPEWDNRF